MAKNYYYYHCYGIFHEMTSKFQIPIFITLRIPKHSFSHTLGDNKNCIISMEYQKIKISVSFEDTIKQMQNNYTLNNLKNNCKT